MPEDKDLSKMSDMMTHYFTVKQDYPDCMLLYRLGDFYEMFSEDAKTCSRALGLTLTGRSCGLEERMPMCGIPAKALDAYLPKMIEAGFKVAICEQLNVPTPSNPKVEREVVRVITPGTLIDASLLDTSNNYLACVYKGDDTLGVSYIDISTGDFYTYQLNEDLSLELNDIFSTIKPHEIIANSAVQAIEDDLPISKMQLIPAFGYIDDKEFDYESCRDLVLTQLKIKSLKEIGCENKFASIVSAGVLLKYVRNTQKRDLSHINKLALLDIKKYMQIDATSRRNLELTESSRDRTTKGSLLWVLDKTKTSMGKRTIKSLIDNPLLSENEINYRLGGVEDFVKNIVVREQMRDLLYNIFDIERLTGRISYNNLTPKDCLALSKSLKIIAPIKTLLAKLSSDFAKKINENLLTFDAIVQLIDSAINENCTNNIKDGDVIKLGFNAELDDIINIQTSSAETLSRMEEAEKIATGIKNLKIGYNRVFGYYIEVSKGSVETVPYRYIRKQTLVNGERFITEELKNVEEKILNAADRKQELEVELFNKIREVLLGEVANLQKVSKAIGMLDAIVSFATVAVEQNYVKPIITKNNTKLEIIGGRHPVVEKILKRDFVSNDTIMNNDDSRTMLITGPNMAGKSTYMRQVALITLMAQIGCFVPAKSARVAITDRIFTRIGASDDLMFGQSTFMVEMAEVSNILHNATDKSLILLDEIGRGTSTFDGLSIAWSVIEYISKNFHCKTLFSTHFHELTDLEGVLDGLKNYKIQVQEYNNSVIFLRKITRGCANRSFGIEVASLANLPEEVVERAKIILHNLEQHDLNKDIIKNNCVDNGEEKKMAEYRKGLTQVAGILNDLDLNTLTPLNAFDILIQLKNYIKKD